MPRLEIVVAFARSIFAKVELIRTVELSTIERRRVMEAISTDIRKFTDLVEPGASAAARSAADAIGVDLTALNWHDQHSFDPGRSTFLLEHVVPVSSTRAACLEATSATGIEEALAGVRVAWVLREEDLRLTELGYRSTRLDPGAAYREAGIDLEFQALLAELEGAGEPWVSESMLEHATATRVRALGAGLIDAAGPALHMTVRRGGEGGLDVCGASCDYR